ncbi:MAG: thymidylate synthase (FAD), partial [Candidatus Lokiarchaeota archaeon]|nr:thymidylate synthase (FAD) [Candidatus Lokiarchaeota archaeon]
MQLIKPSYEILSCPDASILKLIEMAGRVCYKSEDKITDDSAPKFCRMILSRQHESVIEHASMTVRFVVDRGFTHELVRHRLASFSQESTRYCNYSKKGIQFIIPPWLDIEPGNYSIWSDFGSS